MPLNDLVPDYDLAAPLGEAAELVTTPVVAIAGLQVISLDTIGRLGRCIGFYLSHENTSLSFVGKN